VPGSPEPLTEREEWLHVAARSQRWITAGIGLARAAQPRSIV